MVNERYIRQNEENKTPPEKSMGLNDLRDYLYKNSIYLTNEERTRVQKQIEELELLEKQKESRNMGLNDLRDYLYKNSIYLNSEEHQAIQKRIDELELLETQKEQ